MTLNLHGKRQTDLSVSIQRVQHRRRRQKVPVPQVFSAALLEPELLWIGKYPFAVFSASAMDSFTLSPQRGAERSDGRGDTKGRELIDVLHHHRGTNR